MQPPLKENEVEEMLVTADKMNEVLAEENPQTSLPKDIRPKLIAVLQSLGAVCQSNQLGPEYSEVLEDLEDRSKITNYPRGAKTLKLCKGWLTHRVCVASCQTLPTSSTGNNPSFQRV